MKDFYFASDLLTVFQQDNYFSTPENLSIALHKLNLKPTEKNIGIEPMFHSLVIHIMNQCGKSEPFLTGVFVSPDAVANLLREHKLPVPAALQQTSLTKNERTKTLDHDQLEQYFDIFCRNCGTVTDPMAKSYRSPIGRLIFKTLMETRLALGINTTAKYVLEHLTDFDTDKIVTSITEDSVTWLTDDSKEQSTSMKTIEKFVVNFNRELKNQLWSK